MSARASFLVLVVTVAGCSASSAQAKSPPERAGHLSALNRSFRELSARVSPAVVQIHATGYAPVPAGGGHVLAKRRATGSGVVVSEDGHVLTNAHVVQGAHRVRVRLARERLAEGRSILKPEGQMYDAKVLGLDIETDLALLKAEAGDLSVAVFGSSDDLMVGELVLAFGAPFGLDGTVTMGVVSAVARQRHPDDPMIYIQTDAPINPGNSGGPLVNSVGEVVGINTFILSPSGASSGLGFAVPSNIVQTVYRQLKERGKVRRGVIGASTQSITPLMADGLGLDRNHGVIVADVWPGGPAEQAGLQVGDIILALDDKPMENARQFDVNVYQRNVGTPVRVRILRDGEERTLGVIVAERPQAISRMTTEVDPVDNLVRQLGVLAVELDDDVTKMIPRLRESTGVLVLATAPGGAATPLMVGDIIHAFNGAAIARLEDLKSKLASLEEGDPVVLQVERRGQFQYVPLSAE